MNNTFVIKRDPEWMEWRIRGDIGNDMNYDIKMQYAQKNIPQEISRNGKKRPDKVQNYIKHCVNKVLRILYPVTCDPFTCKFVPRFKNTQQLSYKIGYWHKGDDI